MRFDPVTGEVIEVMTEEWLIPSRVYVLVLAVVVYFLVPQIRWLKIAIAIWKFLSPYIKKIILFVFLGIT